MRLCCGLPAARRSAPDTSSTPPATTTGPPRPTSLMALPPAPRRSSGGRRGRRALPMSTEAGHRRRARRHRPRRCRTGKGRRRGQRAPSPPPPHPQQRTLPPRHRQRTTAMRGGDSADGGTLREGGMRPGPPPHSHAAPDRPPLVRMLTDTTKTCRTRLSREKTGRTVRQGRPLYRCRSTFTRQREPPPVHHHHRFLLLRSSNRRRRGRNTYRPRRATFLFRTPISQSSRRVTGLSPSWCCNSYPRCWKRTEGPQTPSAVCVSVCWGASSSLALFQRVSLSLSVPSSSSPPPLYRCIRDQRVHRPASPPSPPFLSFRLPFLLLVVITAIVPRVHRNAARKRSRETG